MKKQQLLAAAIGIVALAVGVALVKFVSLAPGAETVEMRLTSFPGNAYRLSGPYTHENLSVFLIHGDDQIEGKPPLTLEEALERRLVVVHETSEVNELAIENVSADEEVFAQAGDIVKGGKQDRMLGVDLVVAPHSGRIPIDAFCVEQGRWSGRGDETASAFTMSSSIAATKDLKMAARSSRSQSEVWEKVGEAQEKLSAATRTEVRASESASSLQLSLENATVQETADRYVEKLSRIVAGKPDVIGYAFAVNGQINSADVYASGAMFRKLWPKLLRASAVESVAEAPALEQAAPVSADAVMTFFAEAEGGPDVTERAVAERIRLVTREGAAGVFLETQDLRQGGRWIHRSYLTK